MFLRPKVMAFCLEFPSFIIPLLSSCAASLGADMTALLPSARHSSAKKPRFPLSDFPLASDSHAGLNLLNLLLGNYKLGCETPSISTWGKKSDKKGKDTLLVALLPSSKAPTRNCSQFAISALLPTDLTFRSVWVVFL